MPKEKKETGTLKVPQHKLTAKGKIILILALCFAAVGLFAYLNRPTAIDRLSLTYLDNLTKSSLAYEIPESYADSYEVKDATIYGESLVLYQDNYEKEGRDDLYGKGVVLKNLETGKETTFNFSGGADGGVNLGRLDPGVYEVYVYDSYTKKRVYFNEPFESDVFTTMRRGKKVNDIVLTANTDYLERFKTKLDKNYLFLTVTDSLPKVKVVDVLIDPSGLVSYMNGPGVYEGYKSEYIDEAQASYSLALKIQEQLQAAGLKAEIAREESQDLGYYGAGSRIGIGYQKQAKVFLGLTMEETDESRPYLVGSPMTSGLLPNLLALKLHQNGVETAEVSKTSYLDPGVMLDPLTVDEEGHQTRFSISPQIRETGGKATFAGRNSSWTANSSFADSNGMYGVLLCYAGTESPESQVYFLEHEDAIAASLAQGILEYFEIPDNGGNQQ